MASDPYRMNTADFLINAAALLPSDHQSHKLLKSYYLTKARKLSQADHQRNIQNSQSTFGIENCCLKCSSSWYDGNFSIAVAPIKFTKRKSLRIRTKIEQSGKKGAMKLMSKKINNVVKVTCTVCGNCHRTALRKNNQANAKKDNEPEGKETLDVPVQKKPTLNNPASTSKMNKPKTLLTNKKQQKMAQNAPKQKNKKTINNKNLTLLDKIERIGKKNTPGPSTSSMKRNSLLQLAAALKTKTKVSDSDSRLKQMFNSK